LGRKNIKAFDKVVVEKRGEWVAAAIFTYR
jgi:hypothetical protein